MLYSKKGVASKMIMPMRRCAVHGNKAYIGTCIYCMNNIASTPNPTTLERYQSIQWIATSKEDMMSK